MRIGARRAEEARVYDTHSGYHQFHDEPHVSRFAGTVIGGDVRSVRGSFEVFYVAPNTVPTWDDDEDPEYLPGGWYWHSCFPGCLPDGAPSGPFSSSREALQDADEWNPEFDESDEGEGE